jgi:hypothetical protein
VLPCFILFGVFCRGRENKQNKAVKNFKPGKSFSVFTVAILFVVPRDK